MNSQMSITIVDFQWKSKMLIAGHYVFEIVLNKDTEIHLFRRYLDFEWLHKKLIKRNPGCCIPNLPDNNILCNLAVDNEYIAIERKQKFQNFLNYINFHKYLSKDENFANFLDPSFQINHKNKIAKAYSGVASIFSYLWGQSSPLNSEPVKQKYEEIFSSNKYLKRQNSFVERLHIDAEQLLSYLKEQIEIYKKRGNELLDLKENLMKIGNKGFDYFDTNKRKIKKRDNLSEINEDMRLFNSIANNNIEYANLLTNDFLERVENLFESIVLLKECFARKMQHEVELAEMAVKTNGDIEAKKKFVKTMNKHLKYEVKLFKSSKDNGKEVVNILADIYKQKYFCFRNIDEKND